MTYYSRRDYPYGGGDKFFTITFPYIKKEHVEVYINNVLTTNYTYLTTSQISISDSLIVGDVVSLRRNTPIDDRMVKFTETSMLSKDSQNLAQEQMFNAVQESTDNNEQFKINLNDNNEQFKINLNDNNEQFKIDLNNVNLRFKTEVNSSLQTQTTNINSFKSEINGQIAGFIKISETIEADYKNIQVATTTCSNSAITATNKANEAIASANALTGAVNNVTANTQAIGTLVNLTTSHKDNLVNAINDINVDASETIKGKAMLASEAEAVSGANTVKIITPYTLLKTIQANVQPSYMPLVNLGTRITAITLTINKVTTASVTESIVLSLPLSGLTSGVENKCVFDFTIASGKSITLPSGVKWKNGKIPTLLTLSTIRNVLIFTTHDDGITWEGEYAPYGAQVIDFVQPILTSNSTTVTEGNINVTGSPFYTPDYDFFKAMDGNHNTSIMFNNSTGWWQVVYPYYITITGLVHRSGGYTNNNNGDVSGRYYTSASLSTPIGNAFTSSVTQGAITNITGIPTEGIYTNTVYFNKTTSNVNSGIGELLITGTRLITS